MSTLLFSLSLSIFVIALLLTTTVTFFFFVADIVCILCTVFGVAGIISLCCLHDDDAMGVEGIIFTAVSGAVLCNDDDDDDVVTGLPMTFDRADSDS